MLHLGKACAAQVPLGTVVYFPEPKSEGEEDFTDIPDWKPGQPWIGAEDYTSEDDLDVDETPARQISSEASQKARLGVEVADLKDNQQSFVIARGGLGGKGNAFIPRRERFLEDDVQSLHRGAPGERVNAYLEMRILSDIGLVGAPNAGKSSLLRALTAASPKVASYPFTTLQPHLGTISFPEGQITIADIPGIIAGAAENRGLGHNFLRHISRATALAYVVDISSGTELKAAQKSSREQLAWLQEELALYSDELLEKPAIIIANKVDLLQQPKKSIDALKQRTNLPVYAVSALQGTGIDALQSALRDLVMLSWKEE